MLESDRRETMEYLDPSCSTIGCCHNDPIYQDNDLDTHRYEVLQEEYGDRLENPPSKEDMKDKDSILCPCWVIGFALRSRKWGEPYCLSPRICT